MREVAFRAAWQLADAVRNGEFSPVALVRGCLDRIDALNPTRNALVALRREEALEEAAALQRLIVAGKRIGPLAGLPVDDPVLQASYAYEQGRPWNDRWPEI
jgi:Asp-tRNA(Asn)/Glu-tRNA(Gln) amidotransferase A subunit family amidase